MISPPPVSAGEDNPYTRAFHREPGVKQSTQTEEVSTELVYSMSCNKIRTTWQSNKLHRAKQHSLHKAMEWMNGLNRGSAEFLAASTPTIGNLMEHTQQQNTQLTRPVDKFVSTADALERAQANKEAKEAVRQEYACKESTGLYRNIPVIKPDDSVHLMYENFSSLSVPSVGSMHHKKMRQINKLMSEYGVDILAGCKTRTDWRFVESEEDKYSNLFGNGHPTRGACGYNINDGKIKHDQWGGTCISAFG